MSNKCGVLASTKCPINVEYVRNSRQQAVVPLSSWQSPLTVATRTRAGLDRRGAC